MENFRKIKIRPHGRWWKNLVLPLAVATAYLAMPSAAQAAGFGGWGHNTMFGLGHYYFGGWTMFLFWAVVLIGLYYLIKWLFSSDGNKAFGRNSNDNALAILKKRYATGEIDREEFHRMRDEIRTI